MFFFFFTYFQTESDNTHLEYSGNENIQYAMKVLKPGKMLYNTRDDDQNSKFLLNIMYGHKHFKRTIGSNLLQARNIIKNCSKCQI